MWTENWQSEENVGNRVNAPSRRDLLIRKCIIQGVHQILIIHSLEIGTNPLFEDRVEELVILDGDQGLGPPTLGMEEAGQNLWLATNDKLRNSSINSPAASEDQSI
jgi:hypothetical protein